MNSIPNHATPTIADDVSTVIDDDQVIAKTLPVIRSTSTAGQIKDQLNHALDVSRGYVTDNPVHAVLIAAAGSAVLTALLVIFMRGDDVGAADFAG
ncbi:hypothetical protein QTI66_32495 [Variovorax sp. J22R133]|uniref:hypothetical protein n=1 Tax=Variovorax brevis TaxID=3053503 RepID=UPI0025766FA1|nr:hypothetical protein [Variovorax sp. J22R133]MDM0116849.1 hypothetical protein [Variovorax sp. J22R133]